MGKHSQNNKNNQNNSNNTTQQPAQNPAPITLDDIKALLKDQSEDLKKGFDGKFSGHEGRLKKLEEAVFKQQNAGGSSAASSASAPASAVQTTPSAPPASQPVVHGGVSLKNGPGYAYTYWDYEAECWQLTSNIWAAKQASNDTYSIVWAWYKDGVIDHLLSKEEIKKYTP